MKLRLPLAFAGLAIGFAAPALGNEAWAVGEWSCTLQGQNGSVQVNGYDSGIYVREGDTWKICMSTFNVAPKRRASDWMRHT